MPPVQFIAKVDGVIAGSTVTFATPATLQARDTFLAVVLVDPANSDFSTDLNDPDDWADLLSFLGVSATLVVARHIAGDDEGATIALALDSNPVWALAVGLVYRGLDPAAALVAGSCVDVAASTNFSCPSRVLAHYSDLYLGIAGVSSAAVAVTNPGGTTERHDAGAAAHELEVFDVLTEAVGATGAKVATTAANQSGVAASLALAAMPLVSAPAIAFEPSGAIGLPTRGV